MATDLAFNPKRNDSLVNRPSKNLEIAHEPFIQENSDLRMPKRKSAELRLAAQQATTAILAESTTLEEATPRILQIVCESLGWSLGQLWRVDPRVNRLRCGEIWKSPRVVVTEFEAISRQIQLAPGVELPGRIWANRQAAWIPDITKEKGFPRAPFADQAGLHAAFGFPILIEKEVLGVIEFFSQGIRQPNNAILAMMATIGGQIGQFIERKRAEAQLTESEKRFQAFMDNSPAVAFMKDMEGRYVYVNEPFKQAFSLRGREWLGKTDFDMWPPEFANQYRESDLAVLLEDKTMEVIQTCPSGAGGTTLWMVLKFPFQDASGRRFLGGMALDITERRQTEEKLRQTEYQFRQAQKMEAIGRLAGGVAHDFNNLLTIILGYSELMLGQLSPGNPLSDFLVQIKNAGDRAASLTRQLLAFSRQQVLAPKILDLNAVVTDTEKMLRRLIGEDVALATVLDPTIGLVKADPGQIEQVIMNLVINARDAMPEGGKLTIETGNVELDESYARVHADARPGHFVMLAVSDTGCGMDEAIRARIFEPFFTTKEAGKGTGLGLAMVYGIVNQSGGSIYVYSERGQGTTFKIYLPLVDAKSTSGTSQTELAKVSSGKETLLIVEDEGAVRAMTRQVLETCGYRILEAGHGAEAIQVCEQSQNPIHLLVTDVVMPGIGGRQLAETLRSKHPELKVLYLSGYTDDAVVRHGVLEAGTNFLQKPFTPTSLAQKVRQVLDKE